MSTLLEKVAASRVKSTASDWAEYARLCQLGDKASESEAAGLADLAELLQVPPEAMTLHLNAIEQVKKAETEIDALPRLRREHDAAKQKWVEARERMIEETKRLESKYRTAAGVMESARDAIAAIEKAKLQADHLRRQYAFLFWAEDRTPEAIIAPLPDATAPIIAVDDRAMQINVGETYSADRLADEFGISGLQLRRSSVPTMPDGETFFGLLVFTWAITQRKRSREHERAKLLASIQIVPDGIDRLPPENEYPAADLGKQFGDEFGQMLRMKRGGPAQMMQGYKFRGAHLVEWARTQRKRNAELQARADALVQADQNDADHYAAIMAGPAGASDTGKAEQVLVDPQPVAGGVRDNTSGELVTEAVSLPETPADAAPAGSHDGQARAARTRARKTTN